MNRNSMRGPAPNARRAPGGVWVTMVVAATVVVAASSPAARAQAAGNPANPAAVDKMVQMNQKALDDYDTLEWDAAKRTLLEALVLGKKASLDNHPVLARTYIHLGAVYITGYKDKQKGLQSFVRALEIDPTITIQKSMMTGELTDLFAQASKQATAKGGGASAAAATSAKPSPPPPPKAPAEAEAPPPPKPAPPPASGPARRGVLSTEGEVPPPPKPSAKIETESDEPDLPVHINALDCPVADETAPNRSIPVRCAVAPELGAKSIVLFYRPPGVEEYSEVVLKKSPKGWYGGRIPQ